MNELLETNLPKIFNKTIDFSLKNTTTKLAGTLQREQVIQAFNNILDNCHNQLILNKLSSELSGVLLELDSDIDQQFFNILGRSHSGPPKAKGLIAYHLAFRSVNQKLLQSREFRKAIKFSCIICNPHRADWLIAYPIEKLQRFSRILAVKEKDNYILSEFARGLGQDLDGINQKYLKFLQHSQVVKDQSAQYILDNNLELSEQNLFLALQNQFESKKTFQQHLQIQSSTSLSVAREIRQSVAKRLKKLVTRVYDATSKQLKDTVGYCENLRRNFSESVVASFSNFSEHLAGMFAESGKAYNRAFVALVYN